MIHKITCSSCLALIAFCLTSSTWAAPSYMLTDLGLLPGFQSADASRADAINELGQVAGMTRGTNVGVFPQHPSLWSPTTPNGTTGGLVDLAIDDYASPRQSAALGINAYGQVVGESTFGSGSFLWTPSSPNGTTGSIVDLGDSPGGMIDSRAFDVNSHGQVVGHGDSDVGTRAYLWSPTTPNATTGSMIDLGVLSGYTSYSVADGINSLGQVVGKSSSNDNSRAFLWTPDAANGQTGTMVDLGALSEEYDGAEGEAINARGQVAGIAFASIDMPTKAFLWNPDTPNGQVGAMIDLGQLPGGNGTSFAFGINSLGQVVGTSDVGGQQGNVNQSYHGFLWTPSAANGMDGEMVDLNALLPPELRDRWTIVGAAGINDRGQIAAVAYHDLGGVGGVFTVTRGLLLTPNVPEPSSIVLVALFSLVASVSIDRGAGRWRMS